MLSILHYNTRSILLKVDSLAESVLVHEPDIICIVESLLDRDVEQYEILLPNFASVRLDRSRLGRGILS